MKNKRSNNKHELKKVREAYMVILFTVLAVIGASIWYYLMTRPPGPEQEIESFIRSEVTKEDIAPGFEPAIIYYKHPGMTEELFCCVGTLFYFTNGVPQIATAEHVFRTDVGTPQILSVRTLRGKIDPPVVYMDKILATGKDLGANQEDRDIVIASLGIKPVLLKPYSKFLFNETGQNFWGDVVIGKKKVPRMRSIVSGKYVRTLGYVRRSEETNGAVFILIERHTRRGESGTGFVDDQHGIWVVHAGTESKAEEEAVCAEGRRLTGKNIKSVTTVSGPIFGNYQ